MRLIIILSITFLLATALTAQPPVGNMAAGDWMRVSTDDGAFSVEVPKKNKHYANADGFSVAVSFGNDIWLKDMQMINALVNGTLVSIEVYSAPKTAMEALYQKETFRKAGLSESEIKRPGYKIRQLMRTDEGSYVIRQFISSGGRVLILTAGTRGGESTELRRFLDSLRIGPDKVSDPNMVKISSLPQDEPIVNEKLITTSSPARPAEPASQPDKKIVFLIKPLVSYTNAARANAITGDVQLRLKLSEDGWVSEIAIVKPLPAGLLRQTLIGALRFKFLPAEKDGNPISQTKTIEYSFNIY